MATVIDQESSSPAGVATTPGPVANSIAMQDVVPPSHASPPSAHVKLDLLLTSGQRKIWKFPTTHTAYAVKEQVWNEWPSGKLFSSSGVRLRAHTWPVLHIELTPLPSLCITQNGMSDPHILAPCDCCTWVISSMKRQLCHLRKPTPQARILKQQ